MLLRIILLSACIGGSLTNDSCPTGLQEECRCFHPSQEVDDLFDVTCPLVEARLQPGLALAMRCRNEAYVEVEDKTRVWDRKTGPQELLLALSKTHFGENPPPEIRLIECPVPPNESFASLLEPWLQYKAPENISDILTLTTSEEEAENSTAHVHHPVNVTAVLMNLLEWLESETNKFDSLTALEKTDEAKNLDTDSRYENLTEKQQNYTQNNTREFAFSLRNLQGNLSSELFFNLSVLTRLDLKNNSISELPGNLLYGVPNITQLILSHNVLEYIPDNFFHNSSSLKILDLSFNNLTEIQEGLFSALSFLTHLLLSHNKLYYVNQSCFLGLTNLRVLDLSYNSILKISHDSFGGLTKLEAIDLSHNYLSRVPATLFFDLKNLESVSIIGNSKMVDPDEADSEWLTSHSRKLDMSIYAFSNLPKLKTLRLSRSGMDVLPRFLIRNTPKLKELDVRENNLVNIPRFIFQDSIALEVIDASQNSLSDLPKDLFDPINTLKELRLENNALSNLPLSHTAYRELQVLTIHNNSFSRLPRQVLRQLESSSSVVRLVTLSGNPWRCDCSIVPLLVWTRANAHHVPDLKDAICQDGRALKELADRDVCKFIDVSM